VPPPPPKPSDNLTDNIFHANGCFLDPQISKPRWWTTAFGYLSFVPRHPDFSERPFDMLGLMTVDRIGNRYKLRESTANRWARLEANLTAAVDVLRQRYNIAFVKPFSPTAWGYRDGVKSYGEAQQRARLSRDWIVIWMAMLSYSIAIATTARTMADPDSAIPVPNWLNVLTDAGFNQVWAYDVEMSSVTDSRDVRL
jgi:hypothetical protein